MKELKDNLLNYNSEYSELMEFKITDETMVLDLFKFSDEFWDFSDENDIRKVAVGGSKFKFDWKNIEVRVGGNFKNELKVLTFLLLQYSGIFGKIKRYKINSVHQSIFALIIMIEQIKENNLIIKNYKSDLVINRFSDIRITDLENLELEEKKYKLIKKTLKYLCNPYIQPFLLDPISWNEYDIKNLKYLQLPKLRLKDNSTLPLNNDYYVEIINQVTIDLYNFKKEMDMNIHMKLTDKLMKKISEKTSPIYFSKESYKDYVIIREFERMKSVNKGKRISASSSKREDFINKYKLSIKIYYSELVRLHRACIVVILLFTGMRYSEIVSLKKGSVSQKNDVYFIKGTVTKFRDALVEANEDEWIAIPIVRDAIDILEEIQKFTFNDYLISACYSVYLNCKSLPLSNAGVNGALNNYVKESAKFNNKLEHFITDPSNKLTVHRFRHTLAQQLARGKLGLPYISYHLKHVNTAVVAYRRVNNVTLGYGGISKELSNSAKFYNGAKKELLNEIYHPNAVVSGGKNAIEFTKRKKEYFQGLMVDDNEIDSIIEDLKSQALPFLDVGLGYCSGRKELELEDGTKKPPPCIGQLKCNPVDCGNAIIPKSKLPIWERVYKDAISKLNDSDYKYMEPELKEIIIRSQRVINHFYTNDKENS